jgi:hypothetical protein
MRVGGSSLTPSTICGIGCNFGSLEALTRAPFQELRQLASNGLGFSRPWHHWFQGHAAFWAVPRLVRDNFWMHWAGVLPRILNKSLIRIG